MTVKTLYQMRNLDNPVFDGAVLRLDPSLHGVKWAKKVFAFAGFRDTIFHAVIESEDITLKKVLSPSEKAEVLQLVKRLALETTTNATGQSGDHPKYGKFATLRRENKIGFAVAFLLKSGKMLTLEGETQVITDPVDDRLFIIKNGDTSGFLKKSDVMGFWSNYMADPLTPSLAAEKVFKVY